MGGFGFLPAPPGGVGDLGEREIRLGTIPPFFGPIGGGFGPIYTPPPPTFGPMYTPPTVPISSSNYGGPMPTDSFREARGGIVGSIIRAGVGAIIPFLPGQNPYPEAPPGPGDILGPIIPDITTGISTMGCSSLGRRRAAQCYVQTSTGKRRRGRYVVLPNGQVTCCPTPRRMNPANARALTRAARRLKGFAKLEKRIHKALARACGPMGRRAASRYYSRPRCGTCRKTKCVC